MLLLSITDQFDEDTAATVRRTREVLPRLRDAYARAYYAGVVAERHAKALLRRGVLRSGNTCARFLAMNQQLRPGEQEEYEPAFE